MEDGKSFSVQKLLDLKRVSLYAAALEVDRCQSVLHSGGLYIVSLALKTCLRLTQSCLRCEVEKTVLAAALLEAEFQLSDGACMACDFAVVDVACDSATVVNGSLFFSLLLLLLATLLSFVSRIAATYGLLPPK